MRAYARAAAEAAAYALRHRGLIATSGVTGGPVNGRAVDEVAAVPEAVADCPFTHDREEMLLRLAVCHGQRGHRLIVASGVTAVLARRMNVALVVATEYMISGDRFTAELAGRVALGGDKVLRLERLPGGIACRLSHAFAHAGRALFEAVGYTNAVNPDRALTALAATRGWSVWRCAERPR